MDQYEATPVPRPASFKRAGPRSELSKGDSSCSILEQREGLAKWAPSQHETACRLLSFSLSTFSTPNTLMASLPLHGPQSSLTFSAPSPHLKPLAEYDPTAAPADLHTSHNALDPDAKPVSECSAQSISHFSSNHSSTPTLEWTAETNTLNSQQGAHLLQLLLQLLRHHKAHLSPIRSNHPLLSLQKLVKEIRQKNRTPKTAQREKLNAALPSPIRVRRLEL